MGAVPHIQILRAGEPYTSLDQKELCGFRDGALLATVSQANAGLVRRDLRKLEQRAASLRAIPMARRLAICKAAGELFLNATLPLSDGVDQSPSDYVAALSQTSGLPHTLCRKNAQKVWTVFDEMPAILRGLMRGMDPSVVDDGFGEHGGISVCYARAGRALGVVLPSNSPGVNSIWMPAIALGVPVVLKPGREEPWTPFRIIQAFLAAGCPREAFSFYPTDHEGAASILGGAGRALLFGDASTTAAYAHDPSVQVHGPGRSKVVIGADAIGEWRSYLDVIVESIVANGGRSCINASSIFVPAHADELAAALAERLALLQPMAMDADAACLSAFANPKLAEFVDASIQSGLAAGGARDITAQLRDGPRLVTHDGVRYVLPTLVRCDDVEHTLARTEFLCAFASVVEVPHERLLDAIGPSLVVTAITRDSELIEGLVDSPDVDRLNLGPVPTSRVEWDQPHEGNLFEFLFRRRALQRAPGW